MKKLRRIRAEKGLTMDALEERTGVSKRTISEIERGMRTPQTLTLAKLANALDVELDDLLEEEAPKALPPQPDPWDAAKTIHIKGEVSERTRHKPDEVDKVMAPHPLDLCADYVNRRADSVERLIEGGHATSLEWAREFNRDVVSLSHLYIRIISRTKFTTEERTEDEKLKMFGLRDALGRLNDVAKKLDAAMEPIAAAQELYAKEREERKAALRMIIGSAA